MQDAAPQKLKVKITDVKAMNAGFGNCLIKIETGAGLVRIWRSGHVPRAPGRESGLCTAGGGFL
jgi:hypothetical protein